MTNQSKKIILILAILVVLAVGSVAIFKTLSAGKDKDQESTEGGEEGKGPLVGGRQDPRDIFDAEDLYRNTLDSKGIVPEYEPVLANSPEGRRLIEETVKDIQLGNIDGLDNIRGTEEIGRALVSIPNFSEEANGAIRKMFGYMPKPVIADNPYTWPIYGKYEAQGVALRRDLEAFLALPVEKVHLGKGRHENAGWMPSIGLNFMMLTDVPRLPEIDDIFWDWITGLDREGVINYMRINKFHGDKTREEHMTKLDPIGRSYYIGYGNRELAKVMLDEMDRLDWVCYRYAKEKLIGDGVIIELPLAAKQTEGSNDISSKVGAKRV